MGAARVIRATSVAWFWGGPVPLNVHCTNVACPYVLQERKPSESSNRWKREKLHKAVFDKLVQLLPGWNGCLEDSLVIVVNVGS